MVVTSVKTPVYHASGGFDAFHEGESLGTSVSYDQGRVPYKEFLFCHGLFQDPLRSSIAFHVFGRSIGAARTFESLCQILLFVLLAVFAIVLYPRHIFAAFLLVGVIIAAGHYWFVPRLLLANRDIPTVLFLLTTLFLSRRVTAEKAGSLKVLTMITALFSFIPLATFAYSVDRGFYLCAGLLVMSLLLYYCLPSVNVVRVRHLAGLVAGAGLGVSTLVFLFGDGCVAFAEYTFVIMPCYKELMDGIQYPISRPTYFVPCLLIAFNAYWLCVRALRSGFVVFMRRYPEEICLLFLSLFFFRTALGRSDDEHVAYSLLPTYLISIHIALKHYVIPVVASRYRVERAITLSAVIVASCICLEGVYRIVDRDLTSLYFPLKIPDERFIPVEHQATIDLIKLTLKERQTKFVTMTNQAVWYYYLNEACPIRFPVILFAAPRFYQEEVVDDLERGNVGVVLWRSAQGSEKMDGLGNQERLSIITEYLYRRYVPFAVIDGNELWIRPEMLQPGRVSCRGAAGPSRDPW